MFMQRADLAALTNAALDDPRPSQIETVRAKLLQAMGRDATWVAACSQAIEDRHDKFRPRSPRA